MHRIVLFLSVLLLFISCTKKETEYEVTKVEKEVEEKEEVSSASETEKKPLMIINKEDSLKIWVRADGAPGMLVNSEGELEGFYVDLERAVMKEMGQNYEFVPYTDLGPLLQKLKSGEAHVALATPKLPDFESYLNLSIPFEELDFVVFLHKSSDEIIPESKKEAIKALYGKKVGVQTRGHIYQLLRDEKEIELIEYPTTTAALEALHNGDVDAVPDVKRIGRYYSKLKGWDIKPVGGKVFSIDISTSFSKAIDPSALKRYDTALKKLINNGFVSDLYNSYFGES